MKKVLQFLIGMFIAFAGIVKSPASHSYQTPGCEIFSGDTTQHIGKIVFIPEPASSHSEGLTAFGLEEDTVTYLLTSFGAYFVGYESLPISGTSYFEDEMVKIDGVVHNYEVGEKEYKALEIVSISLLQEEVRSGRIVYVPEFAVWGTVGDGQACAVFGLETNFETYVLTADSVFLFGNGNFEAVGQACSIGDSVEISGHIHSVSDDDKSFPAFEIKSINILDTFSQKNISGTYTGSLVILPNPAFTNPCLPGLVVGLECNGNQYILSKKGWQDDYVEVGGVRYEMGDSVEIEGVASTHIDLLNRTYFELEIDTIRKIVPYAQTHPNVVREGGQWDFYHIDGYPSALGVTSFYTLGTDTVIGNLTYKEVLCREKVDTAEAKACPWSLREDEKRLYLYDHTTETEHVLCDFSLRPGDTLVTNWPWYPPVFIVDKVGDTILPGGDAPLRYLAVHAIYPHHTDLWVEKIGPLHYGITWDYLWMAGGVINELLCYSDNGDMCYQNPVYKTCYIHYDTGVFRGKIVSVPAPLSPHAEGASTFGLKVDSVTYTLAPVHINFEYFTFGGEKYAIGDSVEVKGQVYNMVDDAYEGFLMLGVQSIRKFEKGGDPTGSRTPQEIGVVHYDASSYNLVIEIDVKFDRLEVFDAWGRCVMKVERPAGSVSVARLPHGLYLYRLTAAGTTLSGKFVR